MKIRFVCVEESDFKACAVVEFILIYFMSLLPLMNVSL